MDLLKGALRKTYEIDDDYYAVPNIFREPAFSIPVLYHTCFHSCWQLLVRGAGGRQTVPAPVNSFHEYIDADHDGGSSNVQDMVVSGPTTIANDIC
ncbi:hypothetical protein RB195_011927 [Necator americanus]|uniref:Uncharacterized protein n=1 Tax=Necator americanus TaxID=51031 RepID=A0ABR1D4R7_NECAM